MKILFVVTGLGVGGAEQQVITLADSLVSLGHEVSLCYITGEAALLPKYKEVKLLALNATKNPFSLLKALLKLKDIIKQLKPDVVHSHMVHANIMARVAKLISGFSGVLISTAHNTNEGGKLRMLAYRLTDFLADISTNVSQDAVNAFINKKATKVGRMLVVNNGIDINKYQFNPEQRQRLREKFQVADTTKVLIAIGRITEAKDYPNLLQAYAKLQEKDANTILWIVGKQDRYYDDVIQPLLATLKLENKVLFLGVRQDIPAVLSAADIFVLASAWEGLPLVVAEAMACQKLIVATDCGGTKEMLGDCGYLVSIKQPEKLANAIEKAINLPQTEVIEITKKAQQRVLMHYNIEQIAQQWLILYQGLLHSKHA